MALAATEYPLKVLVESAPDMQNLRVATRGVVGNLKTVENPEISFKYEYTVEMDGRSIRVLSNKQPTLRKLTKITGILKLPADGPVIEAKGGLDVSDWRVWALGLLILAAIVLTGVLVSPRRSTGGDVIGRGSVDEPYPVAPGPISTMLCPNCDASIPADSLRCDQCGASLVGGPDSGGGAGAATVLPGGRPVSSGSPETVLIQTATEQPIADLTVRESGSPTMRVGEQFKLRTGKGRIGRDQGLSIRLMDETVSREHATIWWADGAFYLQDDASSAGTIVNGQKITGQTRLSNGDEILLGKTTLVFRML